MNQSLLPPDEPSPTSPPEQVARDWLALIDTGRYAESWTTAASLFRRAVTPEQWAAQAAAVREPLGHVIRRDLQGEHHTTELPGAPDGEYAVLQFAAAFAAKRSAVEMITPMRDVDGAWRVAGYFIR
jgi:hypothetical protein